MSTQINLANLKFLSHSALQTLRSCPRKFELDRLYKTKKESSTIHTAFGSALGAGIQKVLETSSLDKGIFEAFKNWDIPLYEELPKSYKSFPQVVMGLHNFYNNILPQFSDWEIAYLSKDRDDNLKPACELSFAVKLPRGYYYRGFLDAVLKNKKTGALRVLELKTTGSKFVDEATYSNSFQGVGYSIVLDRIAPDGYADYEVLYLVYKTYNQSFEDFAFPKLQSHRLNWINDLLLTVEMLELYSRVKRFPTNGDACKNFGSLCRFYEECNYHNTSIFADAEIIYEDTFDPTEFDFIFTLDELLTQQNILNPV